MDTIDELHKMVRRNRLLFVWTLSHWTDYGSSQKIKCGLPGSGSMKGKRIDQ